MEIPSDADATRINPLSREQEGRYFAACAELEARALAKKQTRKARGYQDLADLHRLMLLQGCRPEELRELEQRSVNLEHGRFTVQFGKSKVAKRTLRMRAEARDIFVRRLHTEGRWIFPSSKSPGRHIGQHQRLQESIVEHSGVLCVPYDFRHTFASRAANEEGTPLPVLAATRGHANLRSAMKYVHTQRHDMDREMARLDAAKEILPAVCPLSGGQNGEEKEKGGNQREVNRKVVN